MRDKIKETKKLKIEHGFALCVDKDSRTKNDIISYHTISKGSECIGTSCSIKTGVCKKDQIQIGNYHTHPITDPTMSIADMFVGCSENIQCIGSAKSNNIVCFSRKADESQCLKDTNSFRDEEHEILQKRLKIRHELDNPRTILKAGIFNTLKEWKQYDDKVFKYNVNRIKLLKKYFDRISI